MIPEGPGVARVVLEHLASPRLIYGGVGGTCYECPFATVPLDSAGRVARWEDVANDPTEAYFRCGLPGRDHEAAVWGEDAPCSEKEWATAALDALAGAPDKTGAGRLILRAADRMAAGVDHMVSVGLLSSRCEAADALLDYDDLDEERARFSVAPRPRLHSNWGTTSPPRPQLAEDVHS